MEAVILMHNPEIIARYFAQLARRDNIKLTSGTLSWHILLLDYWSYRRRGIALVEMWPSTWYAAPIIKQSPSSENFFETIDMLKEPTEEELSDDIRAFIEAYWEDHKGIKYCG